VLLLSRVRRRLLAGLPVLLRLVLAALLLTWLATLLLTIELHGTPTLLGVLVVALLHLVRHCGSFFDRVRARRLRRYDEELQW
jgi:hypothetical protein